MSHDTIMFTVTTNMFLAEAVPAASVVPCWHSLDGRRLPGYVITLAGRCAR
jgi:hypothetical protein